MRNGFYPFVPMFIHEVVDNTSGCFGQVRINIRGSLTVFYIRKEYDLFLIGRKEKTVYSFFLIADLFSVRSVGIHYPQLRTSAFGCQKRYLFSIVDPYSILFGFRSMGDLNFITSVNVHNK